MSTATPLLPGNPPEQDQAEKAGEEVGAPQGELRWPPVPGRPLNAAKQQGVMTGEDRQEAGDEGAQDIPETGAKSAGATDQGEAQTGDGHCGPLLNLDIEP